jgi:amylosucrase
LKQKFFRQQKKLIQIRKNNPVFADTKNLTWLTPYNIHVAGFIRSNEDQQFYCLFNFSGQASYITWYAFKNHGKRGNQLFDHWSETMHEIGHDHEYLIIPPYGCCIMEVL